MAEKDNYESLNKEAQEELADGKGKEDEKKEGK